MEYRQLGKTHLKVSVIGVGTEHLKKLSPQDVTQIVNLALAEGVTYFDLVWTLPNILEGFQQSLQNSNAEAHIAFHLGSCINNGKYKRSRNPAECEKYLCSLLDQLNMDSAPILNIHYVNDLEEWKEVNKKGIVTLAQTLKEQKLADIISISTHDPEVIKLAAKTGTIESVMHQVNMANHDYAARNEALNACVALGIGVVAMKPFACGELLKAGKKVKLANYKTGWKRMQLEVPKGATSTKLLSYTLSQPGVCTAVAGVSSLKELTANLTYLQASPAEKDYQTLLESLKTAE